MKLNRLVLYNFKGIRDLTIEANGDDINIFGRNATGKTTIMDACLWLLFGKDSQNSTKFEVKTVVAGEPLHRLNHEVEAKFVTDDGRELKLKRVFKEVYTKQRGSAVEEFTGHTTDYYINDVPVKEKEYQVRVAETIPEDIFKVLTSPTYFNEQVKWEDRRKILLDIAGDISDAEVISSKEILADLSLLLSNKNIAELRASLGAQMKDINKEIDSIPARIDEANRAMFEVAPVESGKVEKLKSLLEKLNMELADIKNDSIMAEIKKGILEAEGRLQAIKNEHSAKTQTVMSELQSKKNTAVMTVAERGTVKDAASRYATSLKGEIEAAQAALDAIILQYRSAEQEELIMPEIKDVCPVCGQSLPADQIEGARTKAIEEFNVRKARRLEDISFLGKEKKQRLNALKNNLVAAEEALAKAELEFLSAIAEEKVAVSEYESAANGIIPVENTDAYQATVKEIIECQSKMKQAIESREPLIEAKKAEIAIVEQDIEVINRHLAASKQNERIQERIAELMEREKKLAAFYEDMKRQLFLTEEFIRTKVEMLDARINSKFKLVRWRLFEQQQNGGIKECCVATDVNGVPYQNLNNAAKINCGLDIIKTLSDFYRYKPFVFIDNAEAVCEINKIDSQMIRLVVSARDDVLRVERLTI